MRNVKFANGEYYHVYNRGVDKRNVFLDHQDFVRFLTNIREFNNTSTREQRLFIKNQNKKARAKTESDSDVSESDSVLAAFLAKLPKLVDIICYCLNPNHYHFILRQLVDNGINIFMHKLGTGYTNYFNQKHRRSGSLFQGKYKPIHVGTNEYLMWLSGYVNGNPQIHQIAKARDYKYSSYQDYLGLRNGTLCDKEMVMNEFNYNLKEYEKFVNVVISESRERKEGIKEYLKELE